MSEREQVGGIQNTGEETEVADGSNPPHGAVVSIGEFIIDQHMPLDDEPIASYRDAWVEEPWFPEAGESILVDSLPGYVQDLEVEQRSGGRGANQAAAAAMAGADTTYIGRVGADTGTLEALQDRGIALDYVDQVADQPTSQAYVFHDANGENRITCYKPGGGLLDIEYISLFLDPSEENNVLDIDYLLLTNGETDEVLHYVLSTLSDRSEGPRVIFDPAPAAGAEQFLSYDCVDIVTPNEGEYEALAGSFQTYNGTVIRTSSGGALIDETYDVTAPAVTPVDTSGAGDTFNGYLAARLAAGDSLEDATRYAVHAASLSVTQSGHKPVYPH